MNEPFPQCDTPEDLGEITQLRAELSPWLFKDEDVSKLSNLEFKQRAVRRIADRFNWLPETEGHIGKTMRCYFHTGKVAPVLRTTTHESCCSDLAYLRAMKEVMQLDSAIDAKTK